MKNLILTLCAFLCFAASAFAQQNAPRHLFIHESVVKPGMTANYNAAITKIRDACAINKINVNWFTVRYEDNTYVHLFPITTLGALDKNLLGDLQAKIGAEAFAALGTNLDQYVDAKSLSVSTMIQEASYLEPLPGENYQEVLFITPIPGKEREIEQVMHEWRAAYEANKIPEAYHIFRNSIGGEFGYVLVLFAKNPADMREKRNKSADMLGSETVTKLWNKQSALTKKYYWKRGNMLPDLSYSFAPAN